MSSTKEFITLFHYQNLLHPALKNRDISKKWEPQEKIIPTTVQSHERERNRKTF